MGKIISLSQSIYEICREHPEVIAIMKNLGFDNITNPPSLQTVGRLMNLEKGSRMKNIPMERIKEGFSKEGFELIDEKDKRS